MKNIIIAFALGICLTSCSTMGTCSKKTEKSCSCSKCGDKADCGCKAHKAEASSCSNSK